MSRPTFGKSRRLLNARDFRSVFQDAPYRASHRHLLILARDNQTEAPRLGLVIAKKHVRLATQRNRLKRLIRESFRHRQDELAGLDIIVLARKGMADLDNPAVFEVLDKQWRRVTRRRESTS